MSTSGVHPISFRLAACNIQELAECAGQFLNIEKFTAEADPMRNHFCLLLDCYVLA